MNSRRILVPLDGHPASETALPAAVEQARGSELELYLLYVVSTPAPVGEAPPRYRAAIQKGERYLAPMRRRIAADLDIKVSSAVWSGSPAAAIVKAADLIDADLIVMARGGRARPPRTLVGSVVERVLRGTRRHVLVVTPTDATVDAPTGNAAPVPDLDVPAATGRVPRGPEAPGEPRSHPGESYLDALRSVEACEREALGVITTIQQAAKNLERWKAVHVTHAGAGFPKEVTMLGRVTDASTWPTGQQLADVLAAWHSAAELARVAWSRLPQAERANLSPPP